VPKKNSWDTDWLIFSRRARRGALVFLVIFICVSIAPDLYLNYFYDSDIQIETSVKKKKQEQKKSFVIPEEMFDPNKYTLEDWMAIGLSEKQCQSILKYLSKGGKLKYKEDVQKLYVIDSALYKDLLPKIALPSRPKYAGNDSSKKSNSTWKDSSKTSMNNNRANEEIFEGTLEINTASKEELMRIKGIGDYYASEIIKRREQYGGFISVNELSGLYKMTPENLEYLSEQLTVDPNKIKKINVNTASKTKLMAHPLITLDLAKSIVFIRENFGEFKSLDGLLQSPYIDQYKLKELAPYLTVE
jgi:competence ComEA-like helix-hairpin-helix protein